MNHKFQSTPPAKAETKTQERLIGAGNDFNPLHPRRRRQGCTGVQAGSVQISIHSTREGGDATAQKELKALSDISIHSTREGGDMAGPAVSITDWIFQSTPPAKAETKHNDIRYNVTKHFNPLHPRRRRPNTGARLSMITDFNPLHPRRRRQQ